MLPDQQTRLLVEKHGILWKDAKTLVHLDQGQRVDYLMSIVKSPSLREREGAQIGRIASNW